MQRVTKQLLVTVLGSLFILSGRAGAQASTGRAPAPPGGGPDVFASATTLDTARVRAQMAASTARALRLVHTLAGGGCYAWPPIEEALNERRIVVLHINGIRTDAAGYEGNLRALRGLLCDAQVLQPMDKVDGMLDSTAGSGRDLLVALDQKLRLYTTTNEGLGRFRGVYAQYFATDSAGSAASGKFAALVRGAIDSGYRVVVIPHSRGNMVTQHALEVLFEDEPRLVSCVRVVAVAPPDVDRWPAPDRVVGLYARNETSRDVLLDVFRPFGIGPSSPANFSVVRTSDASRFKGPVELHDFSGTYLADPAMRQVIARDLRTAAHALRWSDCATADAAVHGPSTDSLRQLGRTLRSAVQALDSLSYEMTAADRQMLARLRGAWIDAASNGRTYALRVEADGAANLASYGKFVMGAPARAVVRRRGAADSLYLLGNDRTPLARGVVRLIDARTVSLTMEQDETPPRCNPSAPAPRRRWSRPLAVQLVRVDRAVAMQVEREHAQRGSWGVALGGGCGGGL